MTEPRRIAVADARQTVSEGALLVATYDGDGFAANALAGAIPKSAFEALEPTLSNDQPIIFY